MRAWRSDLLCVCLRLAALAWFALASSTTWAAASISFEQFAGVKLGPSPLLPVDSQKLVDEAIAGHAQRYQEFGRALNQKGKIETVLYAFGGADPRSAFRLFQGPQGMPKEVWIVDSVAVGTPKQISKSYNDQALKQQHFEKLTSKYSKNVLDYQHVDVPTKGMGLGANILWELQEHHAQNIRISYKDADTGQPLNAKQIQKRADAAAHDGRVAVEFVYEIADRGQIKEQKVVYVQHAFASPAAGARPLPGMLSKFIAHGYDAFMEKASGPAMRYSPQLYPALRELLEGLRPGGPMVTDNPGPWQILAKHQLAPLRRANLRQDRLPAWIKGGFGYSKGGSVFVGEGRHDPAAIEPKLQELQLLLQQVTVKGTKFGEFPKLEYMTKYYLPWAMQQLDKRSQSRWRSTLLRAYLGWYTKDYAGTRSRTDAAKALFSTPDGAKMMRADSTSTAQEAIAILSPAGLATAFKATERNFRKGAMDRPYFLAELLRRKRNAGELSLETMLEVAKVFANSRSPEFENAFFGRIDTITKEELRRAITGNPEQDYHPAEGSTITTKEEREKLAREEGAKNAAYRSKIRRWYKAVGDAERRPVKKTSGQSRVRLSLSDVVNYIDNFNPPAEECVALAKEALRQGRGRDPVRAAKGPIPASVLKQKPLSPRVFKN
jgi:hypothetical protein